MALGKAQFQRRSSRLIRQNFVTALVATVVGCQPALAQRYQVIADPDSPEGQFLDLINLQSDEAKKLALLERFTQHFPKHQSCAWAYEQLQLSAIQAGQWDKALTFGEKLVQINPDDMVTAQLNLKAAESKGDRATAKLWSDNLRRTTRRILATPPPTDSLSFEDWKKREAIASQFVAQDEYVIFKKTLDASDPRQQIKLLDDFFKLNPDSTYRPQALVIYMDAYRAAGDHRNALLFAERVLKNDPSNESALLTAAEAFLQRGSASEKVQAYSAQIIQLMKKKNKPVGMPEEQWVRNKAIYLGKAHWMIGNTYLNQNRFGQADAEFRAAFPLLRKNDQSAASILFYMGWANYKMNNLAEAARYYTQCAVYRSSFQQEAMRNLDVIRNEQAFQK